jgi:phage shock protein A
MFERLMNVIKAMFNKGMDKLETPEVLAEQAQIKLEQSLKDVKEAVIKAVQSEKLLEQQIEKNKEEIATWEKRAAMAVQGGNDDIAKQCLEKKAELNQAAKSLAEQLAQQRQTTAQLKARNAEIEQQFREFQNKKQDMLARHKASEAASKANELLSNTGGGGNSMDKWEQKIREKETRSAAINEMSGKAIEDKFKDLDKNIEIEDELAALKAKMSNSPKLIVDKDKKTIVDDNVPMVVEDITPDDKKG